MGSLTRDLSDQEIGIPIKFEVQIAKRKIGLYIVPISYLNSKGYWLKSAKVTSDDFVIAQTGFQVFEKVVLVPQVSAVGIHILFSHHFINLF